MPARYVLLVVGAAACSGPAGETPDGAERPDATADAGVDANVPTTAQVVTLTRDGRLRPVEGLVVWSNRADGTVDDQVLTASDGSATIHVESGGSVTAVYGTRLETVLDVEPGDVLQFGRQTFEFTPVTGSITVTWPTYPGADQYLLTNGRFGSVLDFNATSGQLLLADDTTTIDGATYDLTLWRPAASFPVTVEPIPTLFSFADANADFFTPNTPQWSLGGTNANNQQDITADHVVHVPGLASDLSTTMRTYGSVYDTQFPPHYIQFCYIEDVPPSGPIAVPFEATSIIADPTFDRSTRTGTWTRLTNGVDDYVAFEVFTDVDATWRLRAPGSCREVVFPVSPAGQPDLPTNGFGLVVWVSNERAAANYDGLRTIPQWELGLEAPFTTSYTASEAYVGAP
jgi:hypothetical protein